MRDAMSIHEIKVGMRIKLTKSQAQILNANRCDEECPTITEGLSGSTLEIDPDTAGDLIAELREIHSDLLWSSKEAVYEFDCDTRTEDMAMRRSDRGFAKSLGNLIKKIEGERR